MLLIAVAKWFGMERLAEMAGTKHLMTIAAPALAAG